MKAGPSKAASTVRRHAWRLEEAKNRFSEVVRAALAQGPQRVTKHGKDAVVVVAAWDYDRLASPPENLVDFMRRSPLAAALATGTLKLTRSRDLGRDVDL
jgi:prevent-host-death family protein